MLIRRAELPCGEIADVRVSGTKIGKIGALAPLPDETLIEADGGALLPGLRDQHLHFLAYAASLESFSCADYDGADACIEALHQAPRQANGWVRAVDFHESMGEVSLVALDRDGPNVPVRIQHRSGRLWILNSLAIDHVKGGAVSPAFAHGIKTGHFYDVDHELGRQLGHTLPDVARASRSLAAYGIVGFTDMTPTNSAHEARMFREWQEAGILLQDVQLAGRASLTAGPTKVHLHESELPPFESLCQGIKDSHKRGRVVAVHCTTEVELVFTLAAFEEAGVIEGDRIEHASICNESCLRTIADLGLMVVTQPNFIAERGDTYLDEIEKSALPDLYRCASFIAADIPFAIASDAPFGGANPWAVMEAATKRVTASGIELTPEERISPEDALACVTGSLADPANPLTIHEGADASLVVLDQSWRAIRRSLASACVQLTVKRGEVVHSMPSISPSERASAAEMS